METIATGGDSHVYATDDPNQRIYLGPLRVMPLCRAAVLYPGFLEKLSAIKLPPRKFISQYILPSVFYVKTDFPPIEMTRLEWVIYDIIDSDAPVSWSDMYERLDKKMPMSSVLESLVKKRLIQPIGFTPTDALHILGEYDEWNAEASLIGAQKVDRLTHKSPEEFALYTKRRVAENMSATLVGYLVPGISKKDVERVISGRHHTKFAVSVPVVLIGAPSKAYAEEIRQLIQGEIITPEFSAVGNAVGSLVGQGVYRMELLIKKSVRREREREVIDYMLFHDGKRVIYSLYQDAVDEAVRIGNEVLMAKMRKTGLEEQQINISHTEKELKLGADIPYETRLIFIGVGTSRYDEISQIPDFVKFINPEKSKRA